MLEFDFDHRVIGLFISNITTKIRHVRFPSVIAENRGNMGKKKAKDRSSREDDEFEMTGTHAYIFTKVMKSSLILLHNCVLSSQVQFAGTLGKAQTRLFSGRSLAYSTGHVARTAKMRTIKRTEALTLLVTLRMKMTQWWKCGCA